ncbi:hypothetical protein COE75_16495 [Bacillus wiedmannii]|nr:hypothetical protein CN576_21390 [Bacillus wiedmannii]PHA62838.1 hypothetical protein COE75_16495 [Bacillus wiedmannii]
MHIFVFIISGVVPKFNYKGATKMSRYFTQNDMDSLVFYQVPKVLLIGDKYKKLNPNAMKLYIILIDRIKLSMKNNWRDELGRYYVRLSIEKGSELLGFSDSTFKRAKKELQQFELLEEKREGMNKTNLLYPLQLEYTEEDIYRLNNEVDDLFEGAEKMAQSYEERWMVQKELSGTGQFEPSGIDQKELSRIGQKELWGQVNLNQLERSKRTTINNDFNNNNFSNNNFVNKEETVNNLLNEYRVKGLSKKLCLMVLDEVNQTPNIDNFGGYLRTCLETALYRSKVKKGEINPAEKMGDGTQTSSVIFYDWLHNNE